MDPANKKASTDSISPLPSLEDKMHAGDSRDEEFRLSGGWLAFGLAAIFIGLVSGFIMSSATFLR